MRKSHDIRSGPVKMSQSLTNPSTDAVRTNALLPTTATVLGIESWAVQNRGVLAGGPSQTCNSPPQMATTCEPKPRQAILANGAGFVTWNKTRYLTIPGGQRRIDSPLWMVGQPSSLMSMDWKWARREELCASTRPYRILC